MEAGLWSKLARPILENESLADDGENLDGIIDEAVKVLQKPDLSFLFGPDTFAEVSISALLPECDNRLMNGIIDRLIIANDEIIIVDYKTNRHVPSIEDEVPEGLMRQMGAYASAITQMYPLQRVRPYILWTSTSELLPLTYLKVINCLKALSDA
jgi:ATP-dependent helicase/nuclease subunit A